MSDFADLFAVSDGMLDGFYGESFTVAPTAERPTDPNARRVADPTLSPATFAGIWDDPRSRAFPHNAEGHAENATRRIGVNRPMVDYQLAAVPYPIRKGYSVTRAKDGSRYNVADVTPDGLTRATLSLTAATPGPGAPAAAVPA